MNNRHAWSTLQLLILVSGAVAPFFFMASSLNDMSEIKSAGFGIGIATAIGGVMKHWQKVHGGGE